MPAFLVDALPALAAVTSNSDCERVRSAFPGQPVATWSSLAFCLVGVVVAARAARFPDRADRLRAFAFAALVVVTGLGSVAYHGDGGATGRWLHDASFLATLWFMAVDDWRPSGRWSTRRIAWGVGGGAVVVLLPVAASLTNPTLAALGLILAVSEARAWGERSPGARRALAGAAVLAAAAGLVYVLSRTDGPLCDPDSLLQGHGLWHALVAASLGFWAGAAFSSYRSAAATVSGPTTS